MNPNRMWIPRGYVIALALLAGCGPTSAAHATNYTWIGDSSTPFDYNAALNWAPSTGVPGAVGQSDTAVFGTGGATSVFDISSVPGAFTPAEWSFLSSYTVIILAGNSVTLEGQGLNIALGGAVNINNNGTLQFNNSSTAGNATISNSLIGATLQFNNSSTAGNASIVNRGTLQFTDTSSGANATVVNTGGTIDLTGMLTALSLGSVSDTASSPGTITLGPSTLTLGGLNNADTIYGTINGTGELIKIGTGDLTLIGFSNGFSGLTTVQEGALVVNGSLDGPITVEAGATLAGNGTVGNTNVFGKLAPGNGSSIGTLSVHGNLNFGPGATYQVQANAAGLGSLTVVSGNASLAAGASVVVLATPGTYAPGTTYQILSTTGGISGFFSGVTTNLAFLKPFLFYDTNSVFLDLSPNFSGVAAAAVNPVEKQVAQALGALGSGNPAALAVLELSPGQVPGALADLSGGSIPGALRSLREDGQTLTGEITQHLQDISGMHAVAGNTTGLSGGNDPALAPSAFWGAFTGTLAHQDAQGSAPSQDERSAGLLFGADAALGHDRTGGVLFGWDRGSVDTESQAASSTLNNFHAGIYGMSPLPQGWKLTGGLGGTYSGIDSLRHTVAPVETPQGSTWGDAVTGFAEAARPVAWQNLTLAPFGALNLTYSHMAGYAENGGGAADLVVGNTTAVNPGSTLGLRASEAWQSAEGRRAGLDASLGWHCNYGNINDTSTMRFTGGTDAFDVFAPPLSRSSALAGLRFDLSVAPRADIFAAYDGDLAPDSQSHAFRLGLKAQF